MVEKLEVRPAPGQSDTPRPPSVRLRPRRWTTALAAAVLLAAFGLTSWWLLKGQKPGQPVVEAPQAVGVATAAVGDIDVVLTGLGAVTPLATVTVRTQINGQLQQIGFTEGQIVHKGDFLAQIDPRPYEVALEKDQGTLAHDQALLDQARADYVRFQALNRQDSISRQQVEDQAYLVKQYQGTVQSDQGTVDNDRLNLTYCRITSPVDGSVGVRLVDPGNYVQTTDTSGLFVVTQLQPISVLFTLPEDDVDQVAAQMASGPLPVQAYDRTNKRLIATGTLATMDNQIDNTTGTVKLRALFANTDNKLFPQAFVNAHLLLRVAKDAVVVPQPAIQTGAPGEFVYLVKPDDSVAVQVVRTGVASSGRVQVLAGLKPGDRVVTDGLDRLRDGAKISVSASPIDQPTK
jgi:multidrug efflux system membrane fusion protein